MIPLWNLSTFIFNNCEEFSFSYNEEQKIFIDGRRVNGEWVVSIHVVAIPYFAWGFNNLNTKLNGTPKSVIRYYLMDVLNRLVEYDAQGKYKLFRTIKSIET